MCGVPVHAADDYLQKLIALGHRVAVCEQTEDPAEARRRGSKTVVRRAVTRLVTPGTITEDRLLDSGRNNYLAALVRIAASDGADRHALAWIDISTGEFRIAECPPGGLQAALVAHRAARGAGASTGWRRTPRSAALVSGHRRGADAAAGGLLRRRPRGGAARAALRRQDDGVVREFQPRRAFGRRGAHRLCRQDADRQAPADRAAEAAQRRRDDAHRRGDARQSRAVPLDLRRARRERCFAAIDRTRSAAGSRLLAERLASPLSDPARDRRAARRRSRSSSSGRSSRRRSARRSPARRTCCARCRGSALDRGGPRDLDMIRAGLEAAQATSRKLRAPTRGDDAGLADRVGRGLRLDQVPVAPGGDAARGARRRAAAPEARRRVRPRPATMRRSTRRAGCATRAARSSPACRRATPAETGIRSLKIRHNNVLGYFVEVTAGQAAGARRERRGAEVHPPADAGERHALHHDGARRARAEDRQRRRPGARDRAFDLRRARRRSRGGGEGDPQRRARARRDRRGGGAGRACGERRLCRGRRWTRASPSGSRAGGIRSWSRRCAPRARVLSRTIAISAPAARARPLARPRAEPPPSRSRPARRTPAAIWLLTGPNMAGKSTFLRQNALIAILAQAGQLRAGEGGAYRHGRCACSAASARPTISRAGARPSWWRWWRRPRS